MYHKLKEIDLRGKEYLSPNRVALRFGIYTTKERTGAGGAYRVRLRDWHTDPEKCRELELDIDYSTKEAAAAAGWAILKAFAMIHGLGYEHQGDQSLAYYQGGQDEGIGALTVEIHGPGEENRGFIKSCDMKEMTEKRAGVAVRVLLETLRQNVADTGTIIEEYEAMYDEQELARSRYYEALGAAQWTMQQCIERINKRLNK